MNKPDLSERDICTKFITPAIIAGGKWDLQSQIREEVSFTKGRVIVRGPFSTRGEAKRADYILYYKEGIPLAIVEAKDNNHRVGSGMQQALDYALILDVPYVFSSNGDAFLFHDRTGQSLPVEREISLEQFPSAAELWQGYCTWKGITQTQAPVTAAPDDIHAFRAVVLSLAVQGRLILQNPEQESANDHLSEIEKAKKTLLVKGALRRTTDFPEVQKDEIPYEIPSNWMWVRVGTIGLTQTGSTPPTAEPGFFGNFTPFVKPADLTNREINYEGDGLSESGVERSRIISSGSILMVCIGGSIGKTNLTTRNVCCNQQINALTPYATTESRYIMICMKSSWFQRKVKEDAGQTTLPIISKGKWEQLPFPLPPLPEQHRIVAKVDEVMRWCDELEARLTAAQTTAAALLDSTLRQILAA